MAKQPIKFTVVTVTYNAASLIARTIESVEQQDHPAVEHLIIDGNSTDATLEMVHHYMERNSVAQVQHEVNCLSEPDEGIYDAMNKAFSLMTGRYIVFLNAGDTFPTPTTLSELAALAESQSRHPAVIFGDTNIVDAEGRFIRPRRLAPSADLTWHDFKQGMLICHQAFYALMKEAERRGESMKYSGSVVACYLSEGATLRNHRRSLWERLLIMARHFGWPTALAQHGWFVIRAIIKK